MSGGGVVEPPSSAFEGVSGELGTVDRISSVRYSIGNCRFPATKLDKS